MFVRDCCAALHKFGREFLWVLFLVFFFVISLTYHSITGTYKRLPLVLPVLWVIPVYTVVVSGMPSFLLVWALVSFVVAQTAFVAYCFFFVDICQGYSVYMIFDLLAGSFSVAVDLPLRVYRICQFL